MILRNKRSALLVAFLLAGSAAAATLYQVTGPEGVDWNADSVQVLYASWTQSASFSNVAISAFLGGTGTASAYLTTQIGPGTTVGDVVASTTLPYGSLALTPLFSGLSLGPGTYYLLIGGTGGGIWPEASPATVTTDASVSANGYGFCSSGCDFAFVPDGTFGPFSLNSQFLVTGDPAGVPEPATVATTAAALLALAGYRRFRRRPDTR